MIIKSTRVAKGGSFGPRVIGKKGVAYNIPKKNSGPVRTEKANNSYRWGGVAGSLPNGRWDCSKARATGRQSFAGAAFYSFICQSTEWSEARSGAV
jgi:hypothetical protein